MRNSDPFIARGRNGLVSAIDVTDGVHCIAVENGVAKGVQLSYEDAGNLAHFLLRLYNLYKNRQGFHGETPKSGLRDIAQLNLTYDELKYVSNAVHFRQAFANREAEELMLTSQICKGSALENDSQTFNDFADKLNNLCLTLFPEQCL